MKSKQDIQELLLLLKESDESAFAIIYNHFWDKLYFAAYQRLRCQSAAEEVVQDVFLTLWNKREELEIKCLSSYLAAMIRYSVYRSFTREKSMRDREISYDSIQRKTEEIEERISDKLILDKILALSNELPEKCRLVFQYNKLEDQSLKDVAARLNISQKTAEAHLTKALKLIRFSMRSFMNLFF